MAILYRKNPWAVMDHGPLEKMESKRDFLCGSFQGGREHLCWVNFISGRDWDAEMLTRLVNAEPGEESEKIFGELWTHVPQQTKVGSRTRGFEYGE